MRIILIRHAEPDYSDDSLTPKGVKEAEYLAKRVAKWPVTAIYCSPFGRAKATMEPALKALGMEATICDWLREHNTGDHVPPDNSQPYSNYAWNLHPDYWTKDPLHFSPVHWVESDYIQSLPVPSNAHWEEVEKGLDGILTAYGYVREGFVYRIRNGANRDALLVFFCHLGQIGLSAGHLLNISPMQLWHDFWISPASITVLNSEERQGDIASFRCQVMGDTGHLRDTPDGNLISSFGGLMDSPFRL